MLDRPNTALGLGIAVALVILFFWLVMEGTDRLTFFAFLFRIVHVLSAMVWVGLIVFVNFVQLVALQKADEPARGVIHRDIVPEVAWWVRHSSSLTVASGALLLLPAGYALPGLVYGTAVYLPTGRATLLWIGVLAGLAMLMFV